MSARIAKGTQTRSRPTVNSGRRGSRKARKPSLAEQIGIAPETLRRGLVWIFLGMGIAAAAATASALQLPQMVGAWTGERIGDAGFEVKRVEIKGLERMEKLPVYSVALDQDSMAMPLVNLEEVRQRLLQFGWVEDARVYRRLPDTLVIDIVEREPAAVWQHAQRLHLIDRHGVVLEQVRLDALPQDLPLIIGPGANGQAGALETLLEGTPQLRPLLAGATWIGGRRWDLRFHSGELLSLPEGDDEAQRALVRFARMDQQAQLLGRGLVRFDMRVPGKFIVRVSREPGGSVPALAPEAPPQPAAPAAAVPAEDLTETI
ncbi:MAG: cell division protein FtsQ/DivIB [Allosphingosinicella sp.]|uniref:cell division protein FtsQ/DivIB n=1 Tax=Allosphingosinicella sp. TaxID=2823234 RepID=UPI003955CF1E